jgi:hypothetical protein
MIWLGIAIGMLTLLALVIAITAVGGDVQRRRSDGEAVDPLFTTGIAISGAGVTLALTIGPFMYVMLAVGLVIMFVGARRSRPPQPH